MKKILIIMINSTITNNVILNQFLGLCPFFGISKQITTSFGMSYAIIFIVTISSFITSIIYKYILLNFNMNIKYLQTILFILIIASFVQFLEMFLKKNIIILYKNLGIYLQLITTNCAVLGITIINIQKNYNIFQSTINGFCSSIGFAISIILMANLRNKIKYNNIPNLLNNFSIVLLIAGLMSIAFYNFSSIA